MVVERYARDGVYENAEFYIVLNLVEQHRVQGVDSFNEKDGARFEPELLSVELAESRNKVVLRDFHFLAPDESEYVFLEISVVHGLEIVEVEGTVGKFRGIETVHEIVVRGE